MKKYLNKFGMSSLRKMLVIKTLLTLNKKWIILWNLIYAVINV